MPNHIEAASHPLFACTVIAAPAALVASTVAYLAGGEGMNRGVAGGAIQVWAMILFCLAGVTLTQRFGVEAPRASLALLVVGVAGAAGGVGYGIDSIQAALFDNPSIQEAQSAAGPIALQIPGLLFPVSLVATGLVLAHTATASPSAGRLMALGGLLFPAGRIPDIEAVAVACDSLLLISMGLIGFNLLRGTTRSPAVETRTAEVATSS